MIKAKDANSWACESTSPFGATVDAGRDAPPDALLPINPLSPTDPMFGSFDSLYVLPISLLNLVMQIFGFVPIQSMGGDSPTQVMCDVLAHAQRTLSSFRYRQPILNLDRALVTIDDVIAMADRLKALPSTEHVKVSVCLSLLAFCAEQVCPFYIAAGYHSHMLQSLPPSTSTNEGHM